MKTYIVSGAGTGIGHAIAKKLADHPDDRVILCGRNESNLTMVLREFPNPNHHAIAVMDIRSLENIQSAIHTLKLESIDGIIANAGIGGANFFGPDDRWQDVIQTNLTGTYFFVNVCLPLLKKSSEPYKHITIISSVLARLGVQHYSAYCASKSGLLGLMRSWAQELASEKILVNAICPGWVNTQMAQSGMEEISKGLKISKDKFHEMAMQNVPLRKMSEPEEIADLVHYLHHQQSVTGQTLDINNGSVMNS